MIYIHYDEASKKHRAYEVKDGEPMFTAEHSDLETLNQRIQPTRLRFIVELSSIERWEDVDATKNL